MPPCTLLNTPSSIFSPEKQNPRWVPDLDLHQDDQSILDSQAWLNDKIIYAAESLLRDQTKGMIFGWQSTLCCNKLDMFRPVPMDLPFIQILHINNSHWITVSNRNVKTGGLFSDSVSIYDSGRNVKISSSLIKTVCSFFKTRSSTLCFDVMNIKGQSDSHNCGVYAIAFATELAYNCDPVVCHFDDGENMRCHLKLCLNANALYPSLSNFLNYGI